MTVPLKQCLSCVILSEADTRAIFATSRIIPFDMLLVIAFDNSVAKTPAANLIEFRKFFQNL